MKAQGPGRVPVAFAILGIATVLVGERVAFADAAGTGSVSDSERNPVIRESDLKATVRASNVSLSGAWHCNIAGVFIAAFVRDPSEFIAHVRTTKGVGPPVLVQLSDGDESSRCVFEQVGGVIAAKGDCQFAVGGGEARTKAVCSQVGISGSLAAEAGLHLTAKECTGIVPAPVKVVGGCSLKADLSVDASLPNDW